MKDAVYTGADVEAAAATASRRLGVPLEALKYVVLEAGGRPGDEARIAVMLDLLEQAAPRARTQATIPDNPREAIRVLMAVLQEAAGIDISVQIDETEASTSVLIEGPDEPFFTARDARVLEALEYILQRAFSRQIAPRRLVVKVAGYIDPRDERIRELARELAQAVLEDGQPRRTEPMNSYERRLVHVVIDEMEGLATESIGESHDRRVEIRTTSEG
jgi:spoIIIJ-associated protein